MKKVMTFLLLTIGLISAVSAAPTHVTFRVDNQTGETLHLINAVSHVPWYHAPPQTIADTNAGLVQMLNSHSSPDNTYAVYYGTDANDYCEYDFGVVYGGGMDIANAKVTTVGNIQCGPIAATDPYNYYNAARISLNPSL